MLAIPIFGMSTIEENIPVTSSEVGTSVTASGSTNTKGSWTQLIASTSYNSYGIFILMHNTAVASTRTNVLVDIGIGGTGSETVIIPDLIAGNQAASGTAVATPGATYFFPLRIKAGTQVSARCQASTVSDTVNVAVVLLARGIPGMWYGSRVTAYGIASANSTGTSMSPGSSTYATDVNLTASTTYPIKFLQIGADLFTNTAGTSSRGLIRITAGSSILAADLPYSESTTVESVSFSAANFILAKMAFNIPAGTALKISAMRNTTAASRGWAAYGVD